MERISSKMLLDIRARVLIEIDSLMDKHKKKYLYCDERDIWKTSPIVVNQPFNDDLSFSFCGLCFCQSGLLISCSLNDDVIDLHQGEIDLERLVDIYDWIYENEDELFNIDEGC